MKILFFTHYSSLYGANRSLIDIIEGLEKFGVISTVVMPNGGDLTNALLKKNIPFIIHHFKPWIFIDDVKPNSLKSKMIHCWEKQENRIKIQKYNKQQLLNLKSNILKEEDFDVVYSNTSVFDFGFNYSELIDSRHVWHLRETPQQYQFKWIYKNSRITKSFNDSDLIISVSNYVRENFVNSLGLKDIIVEYNSVMSKDRLYSLEALRSNIKTEKSNFLTFGLVGLIHPNKGQIEAIKALKIVVEKFPSCKLLIIGGGDVDELSTLVQSLNLDNNVSIIGEVNDPFEYYLEMDAYLMCSKKEGLGRVTLEAMSVSLPIIAFNDGGTAEIIKENYNGLFYQNGHIELADKMITLITNKNLRKKLGENGRTYFEDNFINEIYVHKIHNHLSKLIN
ncbi:MAG: glycosyltransferase family 4 protein [Nonlabens sp.]|uniref:glycosyltransferase family 4 protein n=1 Tax=Nonlabens sp. TaxID=1888209 RepID=UPI003EF1B6A1